MIDRSEKILLAAKTVFSRYGLAKTTMNDIAREAGIARQTLYNAYPKKEDILRGVVRVVATENIQNVSDLWAKTETLDAKLDVYFEHGPLAWYDMAKASPEVAEILEGIHHAAQDELRHASELWVGLFEVLVRDHASAGSFAQANPAEVAAFLQSTSFNAKYNVTDRDALVNRLDTLKIAAKALM